MDRETFQPISSCCLLVPNENVPPNEWKVDASEDKVRIVVNPALKQRIGGARNDKRNRAILLNSIYFGAVAQCLTLLREGEEVAEQRWAKIFRQRLAEQHLDLDANHESWLAQQLMRHPFVICPLLSGPKSMLFWVTKEIGNAIEEAQAGGDYWQAA